MLEFFRKYQRYFFIVITVMVIASFSFFGTFSAFVEGDKRDERVIGHAIDGSPIRSYQLQQLSRFLSTDRDDPPQRGLPSNLSNDGVIRNDFLRAGLADVLVAAYFDPLKAGFQSRLEKTKRFRPYAHPEAPFLSAKAIWGRYAPLINQKLAALQTETEASPSIFSHLSRLYLQQSYLQPELLRRILMVQHQQYSWLNRDQRLQEDDLALFGFHTLTDWFGDDFLNLTAQFIINSAIAAEQKGYRVSLEEAKGDLIHNFEASMRKLAEAQIKPDLTFQQHLRMIGYDERSASEVWQKVLLFRRYFQDVGQAAFVDRLPYQDFSMYAQETATVQKYTWPRALHFRNFQDLLEFQVYLKAVCKPAKDPLSLPDTFLSIEEVEQKRPELVQHSYKVKMAQLSKGQIGLRASMKEVWQWQGEEKNWDLLRKSFASLPKVNSNTERFAILEKLDAPTRSQIDTFSRNHLVDQNPEWVEEALEKAQKSERILAVSSSKIDLPSVENGEKLAALIDQAQKGDAEAAIALRRFCDDGVTFFRIEAVEKESDKGILPFEKARSVLARMTDQYLEGEYLKVRDKKFKTDDGQTRPFAEVKEEVGLMAFADLFKAMDRLEKSEFMSDPKSIQTPIDFYTAYRLAAPARDALEDIKKNPTDSHWLNAGGDPLLMQFKLERNECNIQRTSKEDWMKEEAFVMMPNQWSPVRLADEGQIVFFYLQDKKASETPILDLLALGKETLAADAQRYLAERLLETAKGKKAIVIPVQGEKE